ncbi:MAG: Trk system potassium transporter TrkA [Acutalibacteraceae bacterium]
MNIIIVGCGKVGQELAGQLSAEGHAVTVMDTDPRQLEPVANSYDVRHVLGNGTSYRAQMEAGILQADLLLAMTGQDEVNLLSCLIARKAGNCQTIARVRNPDYFREIRFIKEELGLSMAINPEQAAAADIARLIQIPSAMEIESFAKGRVNLVRFRIPSGSPVNGVRVAELSSKIGTDTLVCIVERGEEVMIPNGDLTLCSGDAVSVIAKWSEISRMFKRFGIQTHSMKNVMIAGGGKISYYLASMLLRAKIRVKLIEVDKEKCEKLSNELDGADIVCGDATDKQLLHEEGLQDADALVALTSIDEENILLSLYAGKVSKAKMITKISRIAFEEVVREMPIGSVVCPKNITTQSILRYIRAMQNSYGSNVETLYRLVNNRVEALEFVVRDSANIRRIVGVPLTELNLKDNLLICCITRNGKIITPTGRDALEIGDTVIVVTTHTGLKDIVDILKS